MTLRMVPGLQDLRPADPTETVEAWKLALERNDGPSFLALTRQTVPVLDRSQFAPAEGVRRGAYVLAEATGDRINALLLASGSEVSIALEARERLQAQGVATRVISFPSWHLFAQQSDAYRQEVLPDEVQVRVAIEAGVTLGWERWVGAKGRAIGIDSFGASAPSEALFEHFGVTADAVVEAVLALHT
jgi:transketolase